jgi:hypothetical protein
MLYLDRREISCEHVVWIQQVQDGVQWWGLQFHGSRGCICASSILLCTKLLTGVTLKTRLNNSGFKIISCITINSKFKLNVNQMKIVFLNIKANSRLCKLLLTLRCHS